MRFRLSLLLSMFFSCLAMPLTAAEVLLEVAQASLPEETTSPRPDVVYIKLTPQSSQVFAEFTGQRIGEMIEVYIGDQLVFSARLSEKISTGNLALSVGAEDERISSPEDFLEQLGAGAALKVVAPAAED